MSTSNPLTLARLREAAGEPGDDLVKRAAEAALSYRGEPVYVATTVSETAARLRALVDRNNYPTPPPRTLDLIQPEPKGGRVAPLCTIIPSESEATHVAEENSRTEATAFVDFNGVLPEAGIGFTKVSDDTVRAKRVGSWLPATKGVLNDSAVAEEAFNALLSDGFGTALDSGLLVGDGVGENILGITNAGSGVTSTALGADTRAVALIRAGTRIRAAGHVSGTVQVVLSPADAEEMALTAGFADAVKAAEALGVNLAQPIVTNLLPAGSAVVGVFDRAIHIYVRSPLVVSVAPDHSDDFLRGRVAIAAEARVTVRLVRKSALQIVTGV